MSYDDGTGRGVQVYHWCHAKVVTFGGSGGIRSMELVVNPWSWVRWIHVDLSKLSSNKIQNVNRDPSELHRDGALPSIILQCVSNLKLQWTSLVTGIFRDFCKIFLWQESEDTNQKSIFPKFKLIPISRFQVMHYYVCFIAPIVYWVE